jgi:RNA polymerase sigma-70 factor, ECF subfamily
MTGNDFARSIHRLAALSCDEDWEQNWSSLTRNDPNQLTVFLMGRHGELILARCQYLTGDLHRAEDIYQETFAEFHKKIDGIRGYREAVAWLLQTATFKAKDSNRRWARQQRTIVQYGLAMQEKDQPPDEFEELKNLAWQSLVDLPDKYRQPLELVYQAGMTHAEASQALNWPLGTVSTNVSRGLELLKKRIGPKAAMGIAAALSCLAVPRKLSAGVGAAHAMSLKWITVLGCSAAVCVITAIGFVHLSKSTSTPEIAATNVPVAFMDRDALKTFVINKIVPEHLKILKPMATLDGYVTLDHVAVNDLIVECHYRLDTDFEGRKISANLVFLHGLFSQTTKILCDPFSNDRFREISSDAYYLLTTNEFLLHYKYFESKNMIFSHVNPFGFGRANIDNGIFWNFNYVNDTQPLKVASVEFERIPSHFRSKQAFDHHAASVAPILRQLAGRWRTAQEPEQQIRILWDGQQVTIQIDGKSNSVLTPEWIDRSVSGETLLKTFMTSRAKISTDFNTIFLIDKQIQIHRIN